MLFALISISSAKTHAVYDLFSVSLFNCPDENCFLSQPGVDSEHKGSCKYKRSALY